MRQCPRNPENSCKRTRRTPLPHDEAADGSPRSSPGAVAALLAVGFIAAGALLLWGDSKKDDQGYLSTGKDRYAASTYALASDVSDVDLDGAGWIMDRDDLGNVRLKAESNAGNPVFVGIARTSDVSRYLRGTSYTSVTDAPWQSAVPRLLPRP